ncbi:MAG: 2Fe-2S iron-sulfur cluster-binding protein [Ktedonobacterales bacterium]
MWSESSIRPDNPTVGLPVVSPAHMLPVRVTRRVNIAPDVVSVFLVLPGTEQAPAPYLPGQFVTLALPTQRETLYRSYSLCGDGRTDHPWELTIKRMDMGAVSTYFYRHVVVNTLLYSSMPRGTFTLPRRVTPDMVFVFCAVGSGITPIMGFLRAIEQLPQEERPLVQLHYASRSERDIIFGDELAEMDRTGTWLRQWHYLSSEQNRMHVETIVGRAGSFAKNAHWYVCGPETLKGELGEHLRRVGVRPDYFHAEAFATAAEPRPAYRVANNEADAAGGTVRIAETGATLDIQPNETVLTALERHGYRPAFSCRAGACGECKLKLVAGQVSPVGEALTPSERAEGYVLSCIARPMGEITLASGGRPPAGVARIAPEVGGRSADRRPNQVMAVRAASVIGMGALLLGSWNLTNHRPQSWKLAAQAPAMQTVTPAPGTTATPSVKPAPTQVGKAPQPTATPKPKPAPVATATPSRAH